MSTKLTRREILRTGSMLAATVVAAACAPKPPAPAPTTASGEPAATSAPTTGAPASDEKITLRMAFWDAWALDAYNHEAELFKDKYPNVTVNVEMTSFGEYLPKLTAAMAGGVPPDVAGSVNAFFTSLASTASLQVLDPLIERDGFDIDDWLPGNLKDGSWMGDLLAIPFSADALWWFYNVDAFAEAGVKTPTELWKEGKWDWNTYLDVAEQMTKGEGTGKQWGTENIQPSYDFKFYPLIWENGGDLFNADYTKCTLDEEKAVQAFEFIYALRQFAPAPEDAQTGTPGSGKLMMWGDWELMNTLFVGELPFEYSVAPPPASPDTGEIMFCGDAPGFAIPKGVKHPDMSWEFMKWLYTPDSLFRLFVAIAAPPPRISMLETDEYFKKHPNYPNPDLCYEITQERMKAFKNTPKMSNYEEAKTAMSEEMSLVWADSAGLLEGIQKVTNRWTELAKEATIDPDIGCAGPFCPEAS